MSFRPCHLILAQLNFAGAPWNLSLTNASLEVLIFWLFFLFLLKVTIFLLLDEQFKHRPGWTPPYALCYREGCREGIYVQANVCGLIPVLHRGGGEQRIPGLQWWVPQVLLNQASVFTAITWCENENNQLAVLISRPTRVSCMLIKGRSKKKEAGHEGFWVCRRICIRPDWEVSQPTAHMHRMLCIHLLLWLTDRK